MVQHLVAQDVQLKVIHSAVLFEHVAEFLFLVAVVAAHFTELGVDFALLELDLLGFRDLAEDESAARAFFAGSFRGLLVLFEPRP